MKQQTLFPEYESASVDLAGRPSKPKHESYDAFVEKFKPKLTTDDCYTPPAVYDAVLDWVRKNCDIEGCNIVRPFYPGGDFETFEYGPNDVVVDNPPFSIITKIVRWYMERGVRFFLFAPYLSLFEAGRFCTSVITNSRIVYHNGAKVATSFLSNLLGDIGVMSAPDLWAAVKSAQSNLTDIKPKYKYPHNVIRVSDIGSLAIRGIRWEVKKNECVYIRQLDSQKSSGKEVYGGGYLISDHAATAKAVEVEVIEWTLSDRERKIIDGLK